MDESPCVLRKALGHLSAALGGHALLCQIGMTILEVTYARPVCTNVVPLQVMQFARCHQLAQHLMSKLEQSIEWI